MRASDHSVLERLRRFYRGTLFQAVVLGLVSFTQAGIWVALNNLGAGGQAQPQFVNAANVITFVIMVFGSPLSGIVGNVVGLRWVLVFGTLGYVPYTASLYCNSEFGTQWFLLFGATTCGLSAAALWTAEATIGVGYPEPARRGLYVGIWLSLQKLGSIIASAIQLGLNHSRDAKGKISPSTYLVLVGLQCLGFPLALLIAPPQKLIRSDGKRPVFQNSHRTFKGESKALWDTLTAKRIVLLMPIFITVQWGQTYEGNFLTAYFTVRARVLAAFVIAVIGIIVDPLFGWVLDGSPARRSMRARTSWILFAVWYIVIFIWKLLLQMEYDASPPDLDWTSPGFGKGIIGYILYRVGYEFGTVWSYWILGTYDVEVDRLALTTGILRACQSLGNAFSYAIGAINSASLLVNLIVAVAVFVVSMPSTTRGAWLVPDKLPAESAAEESPTGADTDVGLDRVQRPNIEA